MKNFSRGNFKGPRKGGYGDRGDRRSGPTELHDAQCAGCGDRCQVPFRPNGKKPVFCTNCFKKDESGPRQQRFDRPSFGNDRRVEGAFGAPRPHAMTAAAPAPNLAAIEARLAAIEEKIDALIDAMVSDEEI
jgi:CxxC-x17-CxxC domain-containing protein